MTIFLQNPHDFVLGHATKDGVDHTLFWENLNVVMANNGVSNINFKSFMAIIASTN